MLDKNNFYSKKYSFNTVYNNPFGNFSNDFRTKTISGDKVVVDRATGLMWHQSGSSKLMKYSVAEEWVRDLNQRGYAGYSDWRLPTLEEGASLLKSGKMNENLYIDHVFLIKQQWIWTGDKYDSGSGWVVYFDDGYVDKNRHDDGRYVRPVRNDK